jgi:hypothetical protein
MNCVRDEVDLVGDELNVSFGTVNYVGCQFVHMHMCLELPLVMLYHSRVRFD